MNRPSVPPPASLRAQAAATVAVRAPELGTVWPARAWAPRVSLLVSYLRSQLTAVLATLVDFAVMIALVEVAGAHYLAATACGAISGGVTAFAVNRHWSFIAQHDAALAQALRYALVWAGSLSLNCALVYLLTDHAGLAYTYSKSIAAALVGALFNFPLHRYFVFR